MKHCYKWERYPINCSFPNFYLSISHEHLFSFQIRKAWKKMCCKRSAGKATSSSTGTDVPRRKTSVDTNSTGIKSNSGKSDYSYNGNSQNVSEFHNVGYEP